MSKVTALLIVALLCVTMSSAAARPEPAFPDTNLVKTQQEEGTVGAQHVEVVDENCEGVGDEECLMRRTLAAHIDYIYTQKKNP
ncbi:unnamed protein product [Ilex paraguariensis]|uniref:Phytosulfokine n=1 Tax=Ilex paraguariensis TaxID=185542 RepID=A0ABC8TBN3_9AQUA